MNIIIRYLLILTCTCFLWSCASVQPVNFYTLSKPLSSASNAEQAALTVNNASLTPVFVTVPDSLKRPQIVINAADGTGLILLEHERWLSAFDEELKAALMSGINAKQKKQSQPVNKRYRVAITLLQMDVLLAKSVSAHFHWKITSQDDALNVSNPNGLTCELSVSKTIRSGVEGAVNGIQDITQDVINVIAQQIEAMESAAIKGCVN